MSTAVATVRVHPNKYEKDLDALVAFLTQNIDKRSPTSSMKVTSVAQNSPAKQQKTSASHGTFKGKIEVKKYSREEYNSMLTTQCQQLYKFQEKDGFIKGMKTPESGRALEARVVAF